MTASKAILEQLDNYVNIRRNQIREHNATLQNFQQPIIADLDMTISEIISLKNYIINFNERINQYVCKDDKNKEFYEAYQQNVLNLIISVDNKYHRDILSYADIKHSEINVIYDKQYSDFWPVVCDCILTGAMVAGFLLGAIGVIIGVVSGIIMVVSSVPPLVGTDITPLVLIMGAIVGVVGAIIGAIIGGLAGLALGVFHFTTSDLPVGSFGEKIQNGETFNYSLITRAYKALNAHHIKAKTSLDLVESDSFEDVQTPGSSRHALFNGNASELGAFVIPDKEPCYQC